MTIRNVRVVGRVQGWRRLFHRHTWSRIRRTGGNRPDYGYELCWGCMATRPIEGGER